MEQATKTMSWASGLFVTVIIFYILGDILIKGFTSLNLDFLTLTPLSAGRKGGIFPIIVSTLLIVFICMIIVFPVGTLGAIFLSKFNHSNPFIVKFIRKFVEILSGVPSIVFGLFGNAIFSIYFGMGFSILSGGLTLACMALPLYITTVENGLSSIPPKFYLAGNALGLSQYTIFKKILIPFAVPSIVVGSILSIGRAMAETAALIFTSGYVDRMPASIFDSGRSLSIHIYDLAMNVPGGDQNAYRSSFVLLFLIVTINLFFSFVAMRLKIKGV